MNSSIWFSLTRREENAELQFRAFGGYFAVRAPGTAQGRSSRLSRDSVESARRDLRIHTVLQISDLCFRIVSNVPIILTAMLSVLSKADGWLRSSVFVEAFPTRPVGFIFRCLLVVFSSPLPFDSKLPPPCKLDNINHIAEKKRKKVQILPGGLNIEWRIATAIALEPSAAQQIQHTLGLESEVGRN